MFYGNKKPCRAVTAESVYRLKTGIVFFSVRVAASGGFKAEILFAKVKNVFLKRSENFLAMYREIIKSF